MSIFRRDGVVLFLLPLASAFAQPAFEVADVKSNRSGEVRMSVDIQPGGRFTARNVPMKVLIALAYHVRDLDGGPSWLATERFDIVAKASEKTASQDDVRLMLRTLLSQRFGLVTHTEQKAMPAFALVQGKTASKLQRSDVALLSERRCGVGQGSSGQRHLECRHIPMAVFADYLQEAAPLDLPLPVVDQTGLDGQYDFALDWIPATRPTSLDPLDTATPPLEARPTIFDAVEVQLGLKLQRTKVPLPVIVVDQVSRVPIEN